MCSGSHSKLKGHNTVVRTCEQLLPWVAVRAINLLEFSGAIYTKGHEWTGCVPSNPENICSQVSHLIRFKLGTQSFHLTYSRFLSKFRSNMKDLYFQTPNLVCHILISGSFVSTGNKSGLLNPYLAGDGDSFKPIWPFSNPDREITTFLVLICCAGQKNVIRKFVPRYQTTHFRSRSFSKHCKFIIQWNVHADL